MLILWLTGLFLWLIMAVTWGGIRYAKGEFSDHNGDNEAVQHVVVLCLIGSVCWPLSICAAIGYQISKRHERE